jgi:hypothetical protein
MQQVQILRPDGRTIVVGGAAGPRTEAELRALHMQRDELAAQMERLQVRKAELRAELAHAEGAPQRAAIQAQVAEIDARYMSHASRLDQINERIVNADPRALVATTAPPRNPIVEEMADHIVPLAAMFSVFFLAPLALSLARLLWKRGTASASRPALGEQAIMTRLDQLQTSMDTMSLEVERISENQRYVTKLMGEKEKAALPR